MEAVAEGIAETIPPFEIENLQDAVLASPDPNEDAPFDQDEPETPFNIDDYDYETDDSDESLDEELKLINAQLQWEESLMQVEKLVGWVILPLVGKLLGRRTAGLIWRRLWDYFG